MLLQVEEINLNLPNSLPIVKTKIPLDTMLRPKADETCASLEYSAITRFWLMTVTALDRPHTAERAITIVYLVWMARTKNKFLSVGGNGAKLQKQPSFTVGINS